MADVNAGRPVVRWLFTGCILIYAMVVIGGITRLTHSGLSMVEWHLILGSLPPMSEEDWKVPFEKYQQSPEYKILNSYYTLEQFKSIYWWEYIHRFLGRLIGVIFLIPFLYFLIRRRLSTPLVRKCLVLLALGAFQGVLGWYMVKSGLVKDPYVSHYRLAAHLISAFAVFGYTCWIILDIKYPQKISAGRHSLLSLRKWIYALFAVLIIQIVYGAFVAGLKAGLMYPTFPKMGDEWMPDTVYAYDTLRENIFENKAGVQFIHRSIAYVVFLLGLVVWSKSRTGVFGTAQQKAANYMMVFIIAQFLLGIFTILYSVPVVLGVLHQTGAFFLFVSVLFLLHRVR